MSPDDPRHGTYAGYVQGCRDTDCRDAAKEYHRQWRARVKGGLADDDPRHGTDNGHVNHGCRCQRCRAAHYRVVGKYWLRLADKLDRAAAAS